MGKIKEFFRGLWIYYFNDWEREPRKVSFDGKTRNLKKRHTRIIAHKLREWWND